MCKRWPSQAQRRRKGLHQLPSHTFLALLRAVRLTYGSVFISVATTADIVLGAGYGVYRSSSNQCTESTDTVRPQGVSHVPPISADSLSSEKSLVAQLISEDPKNPFSPQNVAIACTSLGQLAAGQVHKCDIVVSMLTRLTV